MFIYIKNGDNNQFLVNTNCPIVVLMKYIKTRLGLAESELIDLCDEPGVLKFLFLLQNSQESARGLLKAKESFIVCIIRRTSDGAYTSVTSLLCSVDSALIESLQTQIDNLEKTRLKQLHIVEARMATSEEINAQALPTKSTKKRKKVRHANAPDEEVQRHTGDRKSRN
ncbi:uncharacterized protein CXorf65 homolog isoform X1 [Sinocyclocheilus rhinocerous]|uniref:uncharacterized protein CXorf65 homolog isoform X1 n=1 Tax=Sinocyclocheilus rhinocerous TaxID=307959 RepID=UPI0007BA1E60|nr:PREDICTED: uncharacterized protein CXorf65 homolog isoform X1 [Sinocyclocheilus rhinocerous]